VLEGFEQVQSANTMFILIGNFSTKSINAVGGRDVTVNAFKTLSDTIASYPFLANNARFLVVPGSQDAGVCGHILPRRAIPEYFMEESRKKIKHLTFTSNPSRLRFYTQEVVIFREDLLKKFQRRSIFNLSSAMSSSSTNDDDEMGSPIRDGLGLSQNSTDGINKKKKGGELSSLLANTIVNQGHLCPLPAAVKPVHWELDYTLRLSPLPNLVSKLLMYVCMSVYTLTVCMYIFKYLFIITIYILSILL